MSLPALALVAALLQVALPCAASLRQEDAPRDFILITVASNETDGFKRFIRSTEHYQISTKVLGKGEPWKGGMMLGKGGGHKVNLLKRALKKLAFDQPNLVVMFTDGYDVVLTEGAAGILKKFVGFDSRIVFAAEVYCWPVESLADSYPPTESPYKYLNSGGFIGYASDIYELIKSEAIKDNEDDQLYYTKLFLNKTLREKYRMRLDTKANIFQNLFGAQGDVKLETDDKGESHLVNVKFGTRPSVLHGNGLSKLTLNSIGQYVAGAWHPTHGCATCPLHDTPEINAYPIIVMALFVTQKTPFMDEFLNKIENLDYPKGKMHLFLYNNVDYHNDRIKSFIKGVESDFISVKEIKPSDGLTEASARNLAMEQCVAKKCGYIFSVDSTAHLDNKYVLKYLIQDDRNVVAPLLVRPYKAWSNFWGDLNVDGFYARSFDYMDIVNRDKRGIWNVPYIGGCYLINSTVLPEIKASYSDPTMDPDMAFCRTLREKGIFMYVDNLMDMGHLVDAENFMGEGFMNPELYELLNNQWDWEQRYIHPEYADNFKPNQKLQQVGPCPDVYWFPIVTERFCKELIEIMEAFGRWSSGTNYDERLAGGYENVPTRDIHMNQVGLEPLWLHFLHLYVRPLQELVFIGYFHDPPKSLMNFVVRYRPDEQPSLRPHHDSSTYTINIALNRPKLDYEGGGCKFIRYNCSVTDTKVGWMLLHPGRLTHYHEGLPVTNGTRYIMISFVDP